MIEGFDKEKVLIIDTETNALWDPTEIHVVCTRTLDGGKDEFRQPLKNPKERDRLLRKFEDFPIPCGHNFISYDLLRVLDRLLPDHPYTHDRAIDTLVVSRLLNYGREGGHSIERYGTEFGVKKVGTGIEDWSCLTEEMVERCHSDTEINRKILLKYLPYIGSTDWESSLRTEHFIAYVTGRMSLNGFAFDQGEAERLRQKIQSLVSPIDEALATAFPPKPALIREITPRVTKHGTFNLNDFRWFDGDDLSIFTGGPFSLFRFEEFNPGSVTQMIDRLSAAGWKPTEKTKGHIEALKDRKTPKEKIERFKKYGWKISEENLKTVPDTAPQATKDLGRRIILSSRLSDLEEWLALTKPDRFEEGGVAVHGDFNPIGAWTQRLSHARPNLANVPVAKRSPKDTEFESLINDFNDDMRGLWKARKGFRLLGTDADGIQMRIFAHYTESEDLIASLISGTKEDGTDIHTLHKKKLGDPCKSRDAAKTFIYAWLLGAGIGKVSEILETDTRQAKAAVDNFISSYPKLKELKKEQIPRDADRGYFVGLDGRKVICSSEHLMLAGYLQNGEAVIMKRATRKWWNRLTEEKIPFRLVTWPHDEWQTEIPDDDDLAKYVSDLQIQAIRDQTEELGMRCPLDGTTTIQINHPPYPDGFIGGYTWRDTH